MGLHVALRDHVKTVFIAQIINADRIRVMAGTDCIDVVLFHRCQVFDQLFSRNNTAGYGAELVAVDAFKNNAFSIQHHDVVFHLKAAESDSLRNQFCTVPSSAVTSSRRSYSTGVSADHSSG